MESLYIAMLGLRAVGPGALGGIEKHVEALAVRMARRGHRVDVFCRAPYARDLPEVWEGVGIRKRPCLVSKHLEAISHTALCALEASLRRYDVVHIHAAGPNLLAWMPRLTGRAVVSTLHGLDHERAKWGASASRVLALGLRCALTCAHETIVVSEALRLHCREQFGKRVHTIPNGVERVPGEPVSRLEPHGVRGPGYVLFLGRLVPEKGVHDLIAAWRSPALAGRKEKLVIAGGSSHSDDYAARLRELSGDDRRIVFTGPLLGKDKAAAYAHAGLFVLPSTLEGLPLTVLEAASHGVPVLTSDLPQCLEPFAALADAGTASPETRPCFTFRAGDAVDLARSLAMALDAPDRAALGAEGRTRVLARHDWDRMADRTLEIYGRALGR